MDRRIFLSQLPPGLSAVNEFEDARIVGILMLLNAARKARHGRSCLLDVVNSMPEFNGVFKFQLVPTKEYYFQYFD